MVRVSSVFVHVDFRLYTPHTVVLADSLVRAGVFVPILRVIMLTTCFCFLKSPTINLCHLDGEDKPDIS